MRPAKTQISLRIRAVWLESLLSAWRKFASLAIQKCARKDSDQTARMRRLIWIFAGRTCRKTRFQTYGSYEWIIKWVFETFTLVSVSFVHESITSKKVFSGICNDWMPISAYESAYSAQIIRYPLLNRRTMNLHIQVHHSLLRGFIIEI